MNPQTASGRRPGATRRSWIGAVVIGLPVLVGLLASGAWIALGDAPDYYVIGDLEWLPTIVGAVVSGLLVLWTLSGVVTRRAAARDADAALRAQHARHRRLLDRLDHELKNPIQGIRAALADTPSARQRRSIEAQTDRLTSLLSDLRKIGEVGSTPLEVVRVDPAALVEEAVASVQELPDAQQRRISLSLPQAPRPLPHIDGDEDLLFLALLNLVGNAVKYSGPGDAVEVRGRSEEGWVVLEVADTGRGIRAEELPLVWEELGRSRESHGIEGAGLGLPLVRAIVERHGGWCDLESWYGEGTTAIVRLPAPRPGA